MRGRPRSGLRRIPISTSIDRDVSDWLDTKQNRAAVVNTALRNLMEEEKKNEVPFLRKKLGELNAQEKAIKEEIRIIAGRIGHIESEDKRIVDEMSGSE